MGNDFLLVRYLVPHVNYTINSTPLLVTTVVRLVVITILFALVVVKRPAKYHLIACQFFFTWKTTLVPIDWQDKNILWRVKKWIKMNNTNTVNIKMFNVNIDKWISTSNKRVNCSIDAQFVAHYLDNYKPFFTWAQLHAILMCILNKCVDWTSIFNRIKGIFHAIKSCNTPEKRTPPNATKEILTNAFHLQCTKQ